MISRTTRIRVRYNETDQMGIVNNACYPTYFEIGRTELFRELGVTYAQQEKEGLSLPVSELFIKYFKSACYDDVLYVESIIKELPTSRLRFDYIIKNEKNEIITTGYTVLAFLYGSPIRPGRIPDNIKKVLQPFFK